MYHVAPQAGAGHGREVRGARVVLAAADDGNPAELTCWTASISLVLRLLVFRHSSSAIPRTPRRPRDVGGGRDRPLWNFSSMGGTMSRTRARISLVVGDISADDAPDDIPAPGRGPQASQSQT